MKKSFFKYGIMAAMMLAAGFTFTACGDDEEGATDGVVTPGGGGEGDDTEETSPIASVSVAYSVKTADIAAVQAVADEVYVRYVDEDNQICQEPFSGDWEKNVQVPAADGSCTIALQVVGVAKDPESLAALSGDVRLSFTVTARYKLNHVNGNTTDGSVMTTTGSETYTLPDSFDYMLKAFNSDEERYGGINFAACAHNEGGESVSSRSFWEANKFVPGE